ncbi:MAG: uracil-DNA glycosylase [Gemmatimonadota bacterium]
MVRCTRCDLYTSRTQVVPGAGPANPRILVIGEAPGASEDREGVPFVGRSGALLDAMLEAAGLSRQQVFIANVIRCRPPENRNPRAAEVRACSGWLRQQIRILRPAAVATLGRFALQHFIPGGRVTRLQGMVRKVDYVQEAIDLFPLVHPSAVLRDPRLRPAYEEQFRELGRMLETEARD